MAAVAFDLSVFRNRYRAFAATDPTLLAAYFTEAGLHCNNTSSSIIKDEAYRLLVLNMIVAHLAELDTTPLVGRVSNVTVGGISTSIDYEAAAGTKAWYNQTKYGAAAWAAMSPYRRALYVAPE